MYKKIVTIIILVTVASRVCSSISSIYDIAVAVTINCPCARVSDLNVTLTKVKYYNYAAGDTEATVYAIDDAADSILKRADFDASQPFDIFVYGFNPKDENLENVECIFSQLKSNAVLIDHSAYTESSGFFLTVPHSYEQAVKYTKSIGYSIGRFLCKLLQTINKSNIHIAGQSLGAHMVGYAADYVKTNCGGLEIVYGLDPARPCFDECEAEHIQAGQADTVVTIQCSSVVGSTAELADYNFISNDGKTQDNCPTDLLYNADKVQKCYHFECISIGLNPAVRSGIWVANKCANSYDTDCNGPETSMAGYRVEPTGAHGRYRFDPSGLVCNKKQVL